MLPLATLVHNNAKNGTTGFAPNDLLIGREPPVTPEQAEVLSLASNETRIQLVLRNPLDTLTAKTTGTSMANLYGTVKPPEPPAPRPHPVGSRVKLPPLIMMPPPRPAVPVAVEVINGNKRVESKFPASSEGIQ